MLARTALFIPILVSTAGVAHAQSVVFTDQTTPSGLACLHYLDPANTAQVMAAGGAAGDFNNDGWQDLFVFGGYAPPPVVTRDRLFINNHDGTFTEAGVAWGVGLTRRGLGVAVGDYDKDGWLDLFVTAEPGSGAFFNSLHRNNGNGTFTDRAWPAGLAMSPGVDYGGGWGAAWGDYDLDGDLDLAIGDWLNPGVGNVLWRNNGNGTFTNVTPQAIGGALVGSQGFSPRFADMDGDRYPELLWTSDFGRSRYLINNRNGTFINATASAGVGLDGNGMGTSVADFNGDGRPDWFVTSIYSPFPQQNQPGTGNMLYMNQGSHHFSETSQSAGVKQGGWGWGSVAADFDHDGRIDLAHTNGWPDPEFDFDATCVFRNTSTNPTGGGSFAEVAPGCGITHTGQGRGMLEFDYDNDGDQDVVIFTNDGPLTLYRNDLSGGESTHWLRIFLSTRATPGLAPDGYGAHVTVVAGGSTQHRWLNGGSNYLSQSELAVHFGLGAAAVADELRIDWPDGRVATWTGVALDRTLRLSSCPGDFNNDGSLGVQDLFDFLASYFQGQADVNLSGVTSLQDIFDFLTYWFSGCE